MEKKQMVTKNETKVENTNTANNAINNATNTKIRKIMNWVEGIICLLGGAVVAVGLYLCIAGDDFKFIYLTAQGWRTKMFLCSVGFWALWILWIIGDIGIGCVEYVLRTCFGVSIHEQQDMDVPPLVYGIQKLVGRLQPLFAMLVVLGLVSGVRMYFADGESSEPTLLDHSFGMQQVVKNASEEVNRGDFVMIKNQRDPFVKDSYIQKRMIGLPGEKVSIVDNRVYINDTLYTELVDEKNAACELYAEQHSEMKTNRTWQLEENEYFVLGDNRDNSYDSRFMGRIYGDEIKAVQTMHINCPVSGKGLILCMLGLLIGLFLIGELSARDIEIGDEVEDELEDELE